MKKYRNFFIGLVLHCLLSTVLFSAVRVYQTGYNQTHREGIAMANVTVHEQKADIQILHYHLPVSVPAESSMLYYIAYLATDTPFHSWTYLLNFMENLLFIH